MNMNYHQRLQHYKQGLGKISKEEFNYSNTKYLQVRSVVEFMDVIGYDYHPYNDTFVFQELYNRDLGFKGCQTLSFLTASNLHNDQWTKGNFTNGYLVPEFSFVPKMDGGYYETTFKIDAYTLNKAKAAKIVEQVFIHASNHGFKCYKDQVKLCDESYEALFLNPIIKGDAV